MGMEMRGMTSPGRILNVQAFGNSTPCLPSSATARLRSMVHASPPIIERRGVCGQNVRSRMRRFATHAKLRADRRRTSAPSRAGILTWRAAGLRRRQRCGPVRVAHAPPATRPLAAAPGRAPACVPQSPGEFDASRLGTANHHGPLSPSTGGCASASRPALPPRTPTRTASSRPFRHGGLRSNGQRLAKPLDNLRRFVEHRHRTSVWKAPMTRSELCARLAARSSLSKDNVAAALGALTSTVTARPPADR